MTHLSYSTLFHSRVRVKVKVITCNSLWLPLQCHRELETGQAETGAIFFDHVLSIKIETEPVVLLTIKRSVTDGSQPLRGDERVSATT